MATVTALYGSSPTALAVTALNGLANAAYWKSAAIDFTTNKPAFVVFQVTLATANSGASSPTGYANVYLACSSDNSVYDGTISAGDAAWTTSAPPTAESAKGLMLLGRVSIAATAGTTTTITVTKSFFLGPGQIPKYGVLVIENESNKTLLATTNAASYLECGFTIA